MKQIEDHAELVNPMENYVEQIRNDVKLVTRIKYDVELVNPTQNDTELVNRTRNEVELVNRIKYDVELVNPTQNAVELANRIEDDVTVLNRAWNQLSDKISGGEVDDSDVSYSKLLTDVADLLLKQCTADLVKVNMILPPELIPGIRNTVPGCRPNEQEPGLILSHSDARTNRSQ